MDPVSDLVAVCENCIKGDCYTYENWVGISMEKVLNKVLSFRLADQLSTVQAVRIKYQMECSSIDYWAVFSVCLCAETLLCSILFEGYRNKIVRLLFTLGIVIIILVLIILHFYLKRNKYCKGLCQILLLIEERLK